MTAQDTHLAAFYGPIEPRAPQDSDDAKSRAASAGAYRAGLKRVFDSAVILLAAPIVLPILGVLLLLVARDGANPFYFQDRIGRNGRVYRMWKLRSMVPDAEECLEAHLQDDPTLREEWDAKQKLLDDPRITPLGRVLRKSSLDELPQLWNVLTGDMSLVGPRPMMVCQKDLYPGQDYYDLRPGITGPWQISDRNHTDFADRAGYDAGYNASLSFSGDLQILTSTVRVVLRGTGY